MKDHAQALLSMSQEGACVLLFALVELNGSFKPGPSCKLGFVVCLNAITMDELKSHKRYAAEGGGNNNDV